MYTHTHKHTHIYMYIHIVYLYINISLSIYLYISLSLYIYIYIYAAPDEEAAGLEDPADLREDRLLQVAYILLLRPISVLTLWISEGLTQAQS